MKIVIFEIVTEDQFDFSKTKRILTRSEETFEQLKKEIGSVFQKGSQRIKIISVKNHVCKYQICSCK
jgi:ABC-type arginine transport system ATPase subunit